MEQTAVWLFTNISDTVQLSSRAAVKKAADWVHLFLHAVANLPGIPKKSESPCGATLTGEFSSQGKERAQLTDWIYI